MSLIREGMDEIIANPEDSVRVRNITRSVIQATSGMIKDVKELARAEKDPGKRNQLSGDAQRFVRSLKNFAQAAVNPQREQVVAAAEDVKNYLGPLEEALSTS
eukprot:TRINITY_DN24699_c0_g1_i1.p1 TRINITY_DN24699_c0_g1~~TRINITY_DN24699_c0_g1_i1.p1  ORF type:complete len:103 (-),score=27.57 TRINITY_DN24699_c0_g1_i1:7-315(-)